MTTESPTVGHRADPGRGRAGRVRAGEVVVGLAGTPGALAALRVGLRSAARRGDRVRVVCAYQPPDWWGAWAYGPDVTVPLTDPEAVGRHVLRRARRVVAGAVAEYRDESAGAPAPDVVVEPRACRPDRALLEAAASADELVLGHRGRGSAASCVLGSTALSCVLHAPCPVTIVPAPAPFPRVRGREWQWRGR